MAVDKSVRIVKDSYLAKLEPFAPPPTSLRADLEAFLFSSTGKFIMASMERRTLELAKDVSEINFSLPNAVNLAVRLQGHLEGLQALQSDLIDIVNDENATLVNPEGEPSNDNA